MNVPGFDVQLNQQQMEALKDEFPVDSSTLQLLDSVDYFVGVKQFIMEMI